MPLNLTETKLKLKTVLLITGLSIIVIIVSIYLYLTSGESKIKKDNSTLTPIVESGPIIPPLESRQKLPNNIQTIKKQIIASQIANEHGDIVLFTSSDYKIIYVSTPDFFLATILKEPIEKNKKNAQDWFLKFGLSQSDLCNLPVRFGLGSFEFKKTNPSFTPFPDGCRP